MRLYLVRHGHAYPQEVDAERHLTEKGIARTEKVAAFLEKQNIEVSAIWQSGLFRAKETADIIAPVVKSKDGIVQHDGLEPSDSIDKAFGQIQDIEEDLMIVGHSPFLAELASKLLTGKSDEDPLTVKKSGVYCFERFEDGTWTLLWGVIPQLL